MRAGSTVITTMSPRAGPETGDRSFRVILQFSSPSPKDGLFLWHSRGNQQTKGMTMAEDEITLIEPTEALRDAYLEFIEEFRAAGEKEQIDGSGWDWDSDGDFAAHVQRLRDYAQGINLPANWVPASSYWLVRGGRILGVCDIRHRLAESLRDFGGHIGYSLRPNERNKGYGTEMLRLAMGKARQLGIDRVLVTCDKDNIASARVILKNGGVLDSESYSEKAGRVTQRYWIDLEPGAENYLHD